MDMSAGHALWTVGIHSFTFFMLVHIAGQASGSKGKEWDASVGCCVHQILHQPEEVCHGVHHPLQVPLLPSLHEHLLRERPPLPAYPQVLHSSASAVCYAHAV